MISNWKLFSLTGMLILVFLGPPGCSQPEPPDVWFGELGSQQGKIPDSLTPELAKLKPFLFGNRNENLNIINFLRKDQSPRILYLTARDSEGKTHIVQGTGRGWNLALRDAMERFWGKIHKKNPPQGVKIDLVTSVEEISLASPPTLVPGIDGIAFSKKTGLALLPEEILSNGLLTKRGQLNINELGKYLKNRRHRKDAYRELEAAPPPESFRFKTLGFYLDPEGLYPLYRGHRVFSDPDEEQLLLAAKLGGDYLLKAIQENGKYIYSYEAQRDHVPDQYNILRHAGTTYSLLELYEATGDPRYLQGAEKALGYLQNQIVPCGDEPGLACVQENGITKLGGNGLSIIAFAKYTEVTGDKKYLPDMVKLANWIKSVQEPGGKFKIHKMKVDTGQVSPFRSNYYPGEAILSLVRLYSVDKNPQWLDVAEKNATYLITQRDKGKTISEIPHDHWLLYGLNDLYQYRPKPLFKKHARFISKAILDKQNLDPRYPDWKGSYYRPPRSTPSAIRSEGLVAAYFMEEGGGAQKWKKKLRTGIEETVNFQLQTQFLPERTYYLPNPERALGGFHQSLTDFEIRIDYVQHNISALLGLRKILLEDDNPKKASPS